MVDSAQMIPIVAVGFSRSQSLKRLLDSINAAELRSESKLIVSLDGGASAEVRSVAKNFKFSHGVKCVIEHDENLGLRRHVLWAGSLAREYGSVVVLEDDLVVDRHFYSFANFCVDAYSNCKSIAGHALYAPEYNENARLPFRPLDTGFSTYHMQVPCSWGQVWTRSQWSEFEDWYSAHSRDDLLPKHLMPHRVATWPDSSWKKYFYAYLISTGRFFSYPYRSYTTNNADSGGTHVRLWTSIYQVTLSDQRRECDVFRMPSPGSCGASYDAFMEPIPESIASMLDIDPDRLVIDLYGSKPLAMLKQRDYTLTSQKVSASIQKVPITIKPFENAIKFQFCARGTQQAKGQQGLLISLSHSESVTGGGQPYQQYIAYFGGFSVTSPLFIRTHIVAVVRRYLFWLASVVRRPWLP